MRSRKLALLLGALLAAACGARTTLGDNDEDNDLPIEVLGGSGGGNTPGSGGAAAGKAGAGGAGAGGAGQGGAGQAGAGQAGAGQAGGGQSGAGQAGLDGGVDAKPDADAQADAHDDVVVTDTGCQSDASCDDQVDCTEDACVNGVCTHTTRDILCDDKLFCTGQERCDAALGCVAGAPINCEDGVACTVGTCNEQTQSCDLTPDDSLCPLSHKCGLGEGCYALAYAHTPASLYEIRLPSGKVTFIGSIMTQLTDIALQSNTLLYGLSFTTLFNVDTTTGEAFFLQNVDASGMVAFDVSPGGKFYVGGGSNVFEMDTQSAQTVAVGSYPPGWEASGDLAFLQGRMLATARPTSGGGGNDVLVEIDLQGTGESKILGATGYGCVWGLAAFGETLYGLTCNGEVLNINPDTGASQLLSKGDQAFWGASAR